ncbi:hypothetical protein [Streptomyces synnematoformans]
MILILLTQNPDAPSQPTGLAAPFGTRLCLAVMDWRANNNVLGTGAHERGTRATDISIDEQGTGLLARGREGNTVRAAFIKPGYRAQRWRDGQPCLRSAHPSAYGRPHSTASRSRLER